MLVLLLCSVGLAQEPPSPLEALRHGSLTIWVIGTASPPRTNLQAINDLHHATPLNYQEQTAGSFGQNAASFGQNSGSYGIPSDSQAISTPKSTPGENAPAATPNGIGYRQQTSGSFGQNASSAGTDAGTYGQTSGSFGQTAGSYGQNSGSYGTNASNAGNSSASAPLQIPRSSLSQSFEARLRSAFPGLQTRFFDVPAYALKDWLTVASGTQNFRTF